MWATLGASVDFVHAVLMASWVVGMPLLFWHRWPRATRAYAVYAIVFIVINQASRLWLGECLLTTLARACWSRGSRGAEGASQEWFTVRLSEAVFRLTPSHGSIKLVSEALILVTAVGMLVWARHCQREARGSSRSGGTQVAGRDEVHVLPAAVHDEHLRVPRRS
jgi:hypothetical protein